MKPLLRASLGLLLCASLSACFPFGQKLKEDAAQFEAKFPQGFKTLTARQHALHYAVAGKAGAPVLLFIHGSPGSWDAWASYLTDEELGAAWRLVAVDRPGFGGSEAGIAVPSLAEQAARIATVLDAEGRPAIVVGHSLGGPVACQLALDRPELVRGLVLLAPSIDPAQEKMEWFQVPAQWGWVRWMLPSALDTCNQEIMPLKGELEKLLPRWKDLKVPVAFLQGTQDRLVPAANADFAEREFPRGLLAVQRLNGEDHFIPWRHPDLVREAIAAVAARSPR